MLEFLEDRTVPSTINWVNAGDVGNRNDPDQFEAVFGANAAKARAIVREAIKAWEELIVDFNYRNPGQPDYAPRVNTFTLSVRAISLRDNLRGYFDPFEADVDRSLNDDAKLDIEKFGKLGKPYLASIDVDDNGGGAGWWFDPTPRDHSEFTNIVTPFRARGNLGGRADFYSTVLRLIGKTVGIAPEASRYEFSRTGRIIGMDPLQPNRILYAHSYYDPAKKDYFGALFTQRGEQGLYEGPRPSVAGLEDRVIANDLMTVDPPVNTRDLISDVDIGLLRAGFIDDPFAYTPSYTLILPSHIERTFLSAPETQVVTIRGTSGNDTIFLRPAGINSLMATVNGVVRVFNGPIRLVRILADAGNDRITVHSTFGGLRVDGGAGSDTISVETLPKGVNAHLDGGADADWFYLCPDLRDLNNLLGDLTIDGGTAQGVDRLFINDANSPLTARTYRFAATPTELPNGLLGSAPYLVTPGSLATISLVRLDAMTLTAAAADATAYVRALGVETTIDGAANVYVGGPSRFSTIGGDVGNTTSGIRASLRVKSRTGRVALTIDDSATKTPRNVVIDKDQVSGFTDQPILFGAARLSSLTIHGGQGDATGGNSFVIQSTGLATVPRRPTPSATFNNALVLNAGTGADTVSVQRTSTKVTINGQRGRDVVNVGNGGSLQDIDAPLTITNLGAWSALTLDNSADAAPRNVTLNTTGLWGVVSGLAPATISVRQRDLSAFLIAGGSGNDTFHVRDTPISTIAGGVTTELRGGGGKDTVHVYKTRGALLVDGQGGVDAIHVGIKASGLTAISGPVHVRWLDEDKLTVDDSGRASLAARRAVLGVATLPDVGQGEFIEGLASRISWDANPEASVTIRGGRADETYAMTSTAFVTPIAIDGGGGVNTLDYSGFAAVQQPPPLVNGIASWLKGEGNANDALGGTHGVLQGNVTFVPGVVGQAFRFDGVNSFVQVPSSPELEPAQQLTLEAWIRPTFAGRPFQLADTETVLEKIGSDLSGYALFVTMDPTYPFFEAPIGGVPVGTPVFFLNAGGVAHEIFSPVTIPNNGAYHHLAATYDGAMMRLFLDGVEVTSRPSSGPILHSPTDLFIGSEQTFLPRNSLADIDEPTVYNRALSAEEIQSIFTAGAAGKPLPTGTPPQGLISRWPANGDADDAIGGNHGRMVGDTTLVAGKVGLAFSFDGDGDAVRVPNDSSLEPVHVSVEAWMNATTPGTFSYVVAKGASLETAASYALYTGPSGGLYFYVFDGNVIAFSPDAGAGVWDGAWHHVVGVFDGSAVRLFVDGAEVGSGTPANVAIGYGLPTTNDWFIGSYLGLPHYSFHGLVDEVAVYNRALTSSEVEALFRGDEPGDGGGDASGVMVNLRTGMASGLADGITGIRNVIGSAGNDVLVGGNLATGANLLDGGPGSDLLIAGMRASTLRGGAGDDLLIGGGTIHDEDEASLEAILAAWVAPTDYATRAGVLRGGLLATGKVLANGRQNTLYGQGGRDFFFAAAGDLNDGNNDEAFDWL